MKKTRSILGAVALAGLMLTSSVAYAQERRTLREWGFPIGIFETGKNNAITDVAGVTVGQVTCIEGDSVRTGVTAIVPHQGNIFKNKVPAAIYAGNGFGKLAGYTQVEELGNIETPVVLTNTLSVAAGIEGLVRYTLSQPGNEAVRSVNAVVGETNDGKLNKIRDMRVTPSMVLEAIGKAESGPVAQGNVGAGTGTICFGFGGKIDAVFLARERGAITVMEFFAVQIANIGVFGNRLGALFPVVCSSIHRTTFGGGKGEVLAVAGADNIAALIGSENRYVGVTQT